MNSLKFLLRRCNHAASTLSADTRPSGPNLLTTPGFSLSLASISAAFSPRCRSTMMFLMVAMSRNSRPRSVDFPILSNSASACSCSRRRASSTPSVAFVLAEGKFGAGGYCCETSGKGDAVDDGEKVGFGCAMPIRFKRSEKAWLMGSAFSGLTEPARMSISKLAQAGMPCIGTRALSSLVYEGFGCCREVRGADVGTAPGALVGNLRTPFCAALDPEFPIIAYSCEAITSSTLRMLQIGKRGRVL